MKANGHGHAGNVPTAGIGLVLAYYSKRSLWGVSRIARTCHRTFTQRGGKSIIRGGTLTQCHRAGAQAWVQVCIKHPAACHAIGAAAGGSCVQGYACALSRVALVSLVAFVSFRPLRAGGTGRAGVALWPLRAGGSRVTLRALWPFLQGDAHGYGRLSGNGGGHLYGRGIFHRRECRGAGAKMAPQHHSAAGAQFIQIITRRGGRCYKFIFPAGSHRQAFPAHLHIAGKRGVRSFVCADAAQKAGL